MGLFDGSLASGGTGLLNPTDLSQNVAITTPDDIQRRLALAQALSAKGSDYSPIQSPWQGLARIGDALVGGLQERQARQDQAAGQANNRALLAKWLGVGSALTSPTPRAQSLASALDPSSAASAPSGGLPTFAQGQGGSPSINAGQLASTLAQDEQSHGLPAGYLSRTAQIESGFNPDALNKGSGAAGLYQFVPSTAKAYGLTDPMNPVASADAAARLASDNAGVLRKALGREPTAGELYLAHQQGAGGAAALLANPDAPAASIVGANAVTANGGRPGETAGQFASQWTGKFGPLASPQAAGLPPSNQVASLNPGFVPSGGATMPAGALGGARSAAGVPVPTDAQGNALSPSGQIATVPGAASSDPLVSVPGYAGQWNKAKIDAAPDGTDVPDDRELSKAQGGAVTAAGLNPARYAGASPVTPLNGPPASSSVVTGAAEPGNPQPTAYAISHGDNVVRADAGLPTLGGQPSAVPNKAALLAYLNDPYTSPAMQQVALQLYQQSQKQESFSAPYKDAYGNVVQRDATGKETILNNAKDLRDADDTTPDIKNYQFYVKQAASAGQAPMPFDQWSTAKARAGAAQGSTTIIDQKGEGAEAAKAGELAATRRGDMLAASDAAPEKIARLQLLGNVLDRTRTGPLAGAAGTVVNVANQLGISPDTIKAIGLDPNQAVDNQVAQKLANELVIGSIGAKNGGFPASNFSVAERQFIEKTFPNIASQPGSNQAVQDVLIAREQRNIEKGDAWAGYKAQQRQAGKPLSYEDFEDQWQAQHARDNVFAPIIQKFNAGGYGPIGAAAPQPNPMNSPAPAAAPQSPQGNGTAPPAQGARQAPDGNWYVADPKRPGKFLRVQ